MGILDKGKQLYTDISSRLKGYATQGVEKIKEARAPDTPLEQIIDDWQSIYQQVNTASSTPQWFQKMQHLKGARDTLVDMSKKYPEPLAFEAADETAKASYQRLWEYRGNVLQQLQGILTNNDFEPLEQLAKQLQEELIAPYEQAKTTESNFSVKDAKEHMEKNGKKYGKGAAIGAALYIVYRVIKR